jgi:hypothetical protein
LAAGECEDGDGRGSSTDGAVKDDGVRAPSSAPRRQLRVIVTCWLSILLMRPPPNGGKSAGGMTRVLRQLLTCLVFFGCSGASWQRVEVDSPYEVPKELTIAVVAGPATREASEALLSALLDGLSTKGIKATIVPGSRSPDATLSVVKWDPGSRGLRWFLGFGGGMGEVVVTVDGMGVDGVARGWVASGFFGGSDENSAEAAGNMIAYTLATGLLERPPAPKTLH